MRKHVVLVIVTLIVAAMLSGCNQAAKTSPSVGVVDMTRVYEESTAAKAGQQYLETLAEEARKEFEGMQADLKGAEGNEEATQKVSEAVNDLRNRINAAQQRVMVALDDGLKGVLQAYRTSKGFDVLIHKESAISYSQSIDVTDDIIAELNKVTLDFNDKNATEAPEAKEEAKQ
ncbi:OmpH family outer membrane protein [Oleidesulfovibrio sp.]|uniref:OmpH family outer membrane protein n=1 Tax=Oleidesulfovibrio sp. TaxID=2909707 RepID=UPI003A8967BC